MTTTLEGTRTAELASRLRERIGADRVLTDPAQLRTYECDGGMAGQEGEIFRKVIGWSLVLLALMCVLVTPQSTPVLDWMIPAP